MKNFLKISVLLFVTVFAMAGCGLFGGANEKEKDALRLATLACEMRQIGLEMTEDNPDGLTKFTQKMEEFSKVAQEIEAKYGFTEENEEFDTLIRDALKKTDCKDIDLDDLFNFFKME